MKHFVQPVICGLAVAAMAGAAGIESWSAEWWVFLVAGNALAAFAGTANRVNQ